MRRRYSMTSLVLVVVIFSLGFVALRTASELWTTGTITLTLITLGFGVLGAVFRRGRKRAFWVGFVLFATCYVALAFGHSKPEGILVTVGLLDNVGKRIHPPSLEYVHVNLKNGYEDPMGMTREQAESQLAEWKAKWASGDGNTLNPNGLIVKQRIDVKTTQTTHENFQRTGHALISLLFAMIGGIGAEFFYGTPGGADENGS
jgi:hypothetical protein